MNVDLTAYIKTAYTMNNAGLATGITYTDYTSTNDATGTLKEQYTMGYDDRGFITSETAVTNYGTSQTVKKSYQYDAIGRLTQATIGDKTNKYTYDNIGNRLTMNDGTDTLNYTYDTTGFNRLMGIKKGEDEYITYAYDGRGNQTGETQKYFEITKNGTTTPYFKTTKYNYDLSNQLASLTVSTPSATQAGVVSYEREATENAYNASGQRVVRTVGDWVDSNSNNVFDAGELQNGTGTKYYYAGSEILYTTDAYNFMRTENILDLGGSIIASKRFEDQDPLTYDPYKDNYYFYHYDKRGSTTAILQPNGTLIKGYTYDEFGNLKQGGVGSFLNEVTFTGSVTDTSSGLQYMNARFYQPSTGRFLTQDTYSGSPYDPWTQHLYSYCGNNPTSMVDPTGHFFNLLLGAIGAAAGALVGVVANGISNISQGKGFMDNWGAAAAGGALTGLAAGVTCGGSLVAQAAVSAGAFGISSMAGNAVQQGITKGFDKIDTGEVITSGVIGAAMGGLSKAIGGSYAKPQVKPNEYAGSSSSPKQAAKSTSSNSGGGSKVANNNSFSSNPKDMLTDVPSKMTPKGNIKWEPNQYTRIQYHPERNVKPNEIFNPRHHSSHYHVELRIDALKGWNAPNNLIKVTPPGYTVGSGTGFLPGELFPGIGE